MSQIDSSQPDTTTYILRWRGREEGPYSLAVIDAKLSSNDIGMFHEILADGRWRSLKTFLEEQEAARRAAQVEQERQARLAQEQLAREAEERAARQQAEMIAEEKRRNDLLQEVARTQEKADARRRTGGSGLTTLGVLLLIGGGLAAAYFLFAFDPSVPTGAGGRVNNLGLMQDRQNGILVSVGALIVGTLMLLFGNRSKKT